MRPLRMQWKLVISNIVVLDQVEPLIKKHIEDAVSIVPEVGRNYILQWNNMDSEGR